MNFEIRPPVPAEARAWEELRMTSWRHVYAGTFTPEMFAKQEEQLDTRATGFAEWLDSTGGTGEDIQQQLGQHRRALVAVEKDAAGKLLGLASQMPYEVQKLEMLYLLPEAFGTGVAQALLGEVLNPGPAELEVLSTNARAIRFYEKEGFTIARSDEFAGRKTYIMTRP